MKEEVLRMWFDLEGDLLEMGQARPKKVFFKDVGNDTFVRVDMKGNVTGFIISNATKGMKRMREAKIPLKATFLQA